MVLPCLGVWDGEILSQVSNTGCVLRSAGPMRRRDLSQIRMATPGATDLLKNRRESPFVST